MNVDALEMLKLVEEIVKEYEKSETHAIFFYSTDRQRDFGILEDKIKNYRSRLDKILSGNDTGAFSNDNK